MTTGRRGTDHGFVFATTGPHHTALARSAVRTLRRAMPDDPVDLFTDQDVRDPAFDHIHRLERSWFRPKMEALRRSRFERTVHLDSDCLVLADVSDLFEVLKRFDLIGAQMIRTNWKMGRRYQDGSIPPSFPQINSGMIGVARSARTDAFLVEWERRLRDSGGEHDQPHLRALLWEGELRYHVVPSQYNMMSYSTLSSWDSSYLAPRILHLGGLMNRLPSEPEQAFDLDALIGRPMADHVRRLQAADPTIGGDPDRTVAGLNQPPLTIRAGKLKAKAARLLQSWRRDLRSN